MQLLLPPQSTKKREKLLVRTCEELNATTSHRAGVLLFHKQRTVGGGMEPVNIYVVPSGFNEIDHPRVSAVLVGHSLSDAAAHMASVHLVARCSSLAELEHPSVCLAIVPFIPPDHKAPQGACAQCPRPRHHHRPGSRQ